MGNIEGGNTPRNGISYVNLKSLRSALRDNVIGKPSLDFGTPIDSGPPRLNPGPPICHVLHPPLICSPWARMCIACCSSPCLPPHFKGGSLTSNWPAAKLYVFPPINVLTLVLCMIRKEGASMSFLKGVRNCIPAPSFSPALGLRGGVKSSFTATTRDFIIRWYEGAISQSALLLALASAKCIGDLHAFSVNSDCIHLGPGDFGITLRLAEIGLRA